MIVNIQKLQHELDDPLQLYQQGLITNTELKNSLRKIIDSLPDDVPGCIDHNTGLLFPRR